MRKREVAVIGFGKVGRACGELILASQDFRLSGIVRRSENVGQPLPDSFHGVPVVAHHTELGAAEAMLLCVPPDAAGDVAVGVLQHGRSLVDASIFHGQAFHAHKERVQKQAIRHKVPAIVGAGWDPGALSLIRGVLELLIPKGHTQAVRRSGKNLHHTVTVESVPGVKAALSTERVTAQGKSQRYVYVEIEAGRDQEKIVEAIQTDPLFLGEETLVFPVDSVASLEEEGHGLFLERRGSSGRIGHQHLLLEARFDVTAFTAQVMVAATRLLPHLQSGAYSLLELPVGLLFGRQLDKAEMELM